MIVVDIISLMVVDVGFRALDLDGGFVCNDVFVRVALLFG